MPRGHRGAFPPGDTDRRGTGAPAGHPRWPGPARLSARPASPPLRRPRPPRPTLHLVPSVLDPLADRTRPGEGSRRAVERHFVIVERPFLHVADAVRDDAVDDECRVIQAAEVLAQEGVAVPDLLEDGPVVDHLGDAGDPDLVVLVVKIDELDAGIGRDLDRLVIAPEVGDVDREAVGPDRGDGAGARLFAVDRGEAGEPG